MGTKSKYIFFILAGFINLCSCTDINKRDIKPDINDKTAIRKIYTIAFYNVENLFDTEKDKYSDDEEFTPEGSKNWTTDKYKKKINNVSYVISQIEKENSANKPAIIGLAEVENRKVLVDLTSNRNISGSGYKIIHHDSPDPRGIDVALLYNPQLFKISSEKTIKYQHPKYPNFKTRELLLVNGILANDSIYIIVNHWVSRKGENNAELRDYNAMLCKNVCDSLLKSNQNAKIIIMGDLNDNPNDRSCRVILNARKEKKDVKEGGFFNPMWKIYSSGQGTTCYQNNWDLFDQIIISESLLNSPTGFRYSDIKIFNPDFLIQQKGRYKGYPLRTFSGNTFLNGYSDHFPIIMYLYKPQ
ncbi:MAG: endonuclease/exonuclease/phosphatase family protein [Dysgonomonas sp.]